MRTLLIGLGGMLWGLVVPASVTAAREPYLAIRTGLKCSHCHTNHTGGGKRTDFGAIYSQTRLPLSIVRGGDEGALLAPQLSRYLSLGANARFRVWQQFTGENPKNEFEMAEANLYAEARVVPERVTVYADQALAPGNLRTRELFLLLERLPGEGYLKLGRFFLPYGFRLLDDGEYVRQRTGFNFANADLGVELGLEPGPLSLALAVSNGTQGAAENNNAKQLSALVSLVFRDLRVGASASRNVGPAGRRDLIGGFGGFRLGRLALLGEADLIVDDPPTGRRGDQFAAFIEGNLLVAQGVNAKVSYGYLDPDRDIGENARIRLRFGGELFAIQFLQLSVFYTLLNDIPQARTDRDRLSLELHAFF